MANDSNVELVYEAPAPPARSGTLAAFGLMAGGLFMVVMGGCFCIGILITFQHIGFSGAPQQLPMTPGDWVFTGVLSLLALASFGGAVVLIMLGTKALLRITRG